MTETGRSFGSRVMHRDRAMVLASLGGIASLAWLLTYYITTRMDLMSEDLVLASTVWFVMMVAMMLPSVSPTVLMFATILRSRGSFPSTKSAIFALGYLLVWSGFSIAAALTQFAMHGAVSLPPTIGGAVIVAAGIFQFTPLKQACLRHCRSPQGFFMTEWREGPGGALAMGFKNGIYCLGCCWLLMALLFVLGTMNLVWMAALAILVLVEKIAPHGEGLSRTAGLFLVGAGLAMVTGVFPHLLSLNFPNL